MNNSINNCGYTHHVGQTTNKVDGLKWNMRNDKVYKIIEWMNNESS